MVEEVYVSFEVAKFLKEKGFDADCRYVYDHEGQKIASEVFMEGESLVRNADIEVKANYDGWLSFIKGDYAYLCPTLQMALDWFRTEKGIAITPIVRSILDDEKFLWEGEIVVAATHDVYHQSWTYETYEGFAEAGIKYCFENLI